MFACFVSAFVLVLRAHPQRSPEKEGSNAGTLTLHRPIERELGPGRTDVFTVKASSGRFMRVEIEKKGVDVSVAIESPAGQTLLTADGPSHAFGRLPASVVAAQSGRYRLVVTKSPRSEETGRYRIELTDLRAPSPQDATRMQAERELYAATLAERAQDKESRNQAIAGYRKAAGLWHALGDPYQEGLCLQRIGVVSAALGEHQKALDAYNLALPLQVAADDRVGQANTWSGIGDSYADMGDQRKALDSYNHGLPLRRAAGDQDGEADTLSDLGRVYADSGDRQKALEFYNQALPLLRAAGNRAGEASLLSRIGLGYSLSGDKPKALDYYNQALLLLRAVGDRNGEANTLVNLGNVYLDLGQVPKALDYYNLALPLKRAAGDRAGEAAALNNMGRVYSSLGEKQKALEYYNQALPIEREAGERRSEAITLGAIGNVFWDLGEMQKALESYNQALPLQRAVGSLAGEAGALTNIGNVYATLGDRQKALQFFEQALPLKRKAGDRAGEANTLSSLGQLYEELGEKQKAVDCYNQALALQRAIGRRAGEANTLNNLGQVYVDLGQRPKALDQYLEALRLARAVANPMLEGDVLNNLMRYWETEGQPAVAILFGKQAVNLHQEIRKNIQNLSQELQRSYLSTVNDHYRHLADLLIGQGRLSEAEQVLSLLKGQEYLDYVRRDAGEESSLPGQADLTPEEAACEKRYREIADRLVGIGAERGALLAKPSLTPEEKGRLEEFEKDIAVGNSQLERALVEIARDSSGGQAAAARKVEELRETQGIMEDLRELPAGTVAVYTLVGSDKFRLILRTPDAQKAYEYSISAVDLNRKVLEFRQVVRDPNLDPRPLALELYNILVAPMADDLRQAHARTLMWSLDGSLRYLPLGALWDGHQYLIEQYRASVMTLASNSRLKDKPDAEWKAAGFGVTRAFADSPALPSVSSELAGIIAVNPGDRGVLSGEIELDDRFTQQSLRDTLRKRYQVVHIASHFRFQPGNETQSFLLLGDGGHLSLAQLKTSANLFGGVQLLTLSACNTGMGDGTEVEGFGTLAQRQGAKAVIATLWPVADVSTSLLMQEFYRIRESSAEKTKLEALQDAQLELLHGSAKAEPLAATRALVHEPEIAGEKPQAPPFTRDANAPFAHPYYWAPFFLMGNWL
jgi:CHAT domain-containing protein/Tfp pilus assembly protein PilF